MVRSDAVAQASTKAYGVLSEQPSSVVGISASKRSQIVISAILDPLGKTHILSVFGDPIWEMWPFVKILNTAQGKKKLQWHVIPEKFRDDCKAVLYAYWKVGREGWSEPGVRSLQITLWTLACFTQYLERIGLRSFAEVHPIHVANYVHHQKEKGLVAPTLATRFSALELLHLFAQHADNGLQEHPWPDSSAMDMAGMTGRSAKCSNMVGKTPLIPQDVQQKLFRYAKAILTNADSLLDERDGGVRLTYKEPELAAIFTACYYLIGCLTGMRGSEISAIKTGAGRLVEKDGVNYYFLTSTEFKTKKGAVDYMMPFMLFEVLRIAERISEPHRKKIAENIARWEALAGTPEYVQVLEKLSFAKEIKGCLFLGHPNGGLVPISQDGWGRKLKTFARDAGVDWALAPHQLRRLFAYTFVRHRLGNILFLKEQLKHSSLSMTQLYGASPRQDAALYDEILQEIHRQKADLILHWMDSDKLLAGGAGEKIMEMRALDYPSRAALINQTSKDLQIRSTGHSWCIAQDEGCGGAGMYEEARCTGCGNGVIDGSFTPVWQEIYLHQCELLDELKDLGPGAAIRVNRDLEAAEKVLKKLGVAMVREEGNGQTTSH